MHMSDTRQPILCHVLCFSQWDQIPPLVTQWSNENNLSNFEICIPAQFTSFHSVFHSFHGLINSINWPASSMGFQNSAGRALQRERRGHGFESR